MNNMDKELIQAFSKLIDDPAMKAIQDKILEMREQIPKEPGYYAENKDHAHLYHGYELALIEINNYIFNYMQYAIKDKAESGQDSGETPVEQAN